MRAATSWTLLVPLLVASSLGAVVTPAWAEDNPELLQARKELDGLQYDKARASLDRALATGTNSPGQVAEIHLLSGQVASSLGNAALAEDHFKRLLALQPEARLTAGVSPKISVPFETAQKWMAGRKPLRVSHVVSTDDEPAVAITVESDPLQMVAAARATYRTGDGREGTAEAGGTTPFVLTFPGGDSLAVVASVVDRYGNRLVELEISIAASAGKIVDPGPRRAARPIYARWWLWGGVALACAGGATYFGLDALAASDELEALNADSMNHDFSEARAIEDRGRQSALFANIGFGVAGVAAVAATWLLVVDLRASGSADQASVVPLEGGGGAFVVSGSF